MLSGLLLAIVHLFLPLITNGYAAISMERMFFMRSYPFHMRNNDCSYLITRTSSYVPFLKARTNAMTMAMMVANSEKLAEAVYIPPRYLLDVARDKKNQRLTVADVVACSGTDFSTAKRDLLMLASVLRSNLEVSSSGELLFNIPGNYESLLYQRSVGRRVQQLYQTASPTLFYLFRVSFGVMIVGSTAVLATFIFMSMCGRSEESESDNKSGSKSSSSSRSSSVSVGLFDVVDLIRIITYKDEDAGVGNFLEAVYSYLFGDEDPNKDYQSQLSRRVAATIRQNDGIVIAEQIAAYADAPAMLPTAADAYSAAGVDESYMLPMAVRFGGSPVVTAEGNIVYHFEELMTTASSSTVVADRVSPLTTDTAILEKQLRFSKMPHKVLRYAGGLGLFNLGLVGVAATVVASTSSNMVLRRVRRVVVCLSSVCLPSLITVDQAVSHRDMAAAGVPIPSSLQIAIQRHPSDKISLAEIQELADQ